MTSGDRERYSRQILFQEIGEHGQERLLKGHAAIVGCGALGSLQATALARAGIRAGGIMGWGATSSTPDFFDTTRGAAAGFEVGVKLLVFDLSANFLQVIDGSGRTGTLTRVLGGFVIALAFKVQEQGRSESPGQIRQFLVENTDQLAAGKYRQGII